MRSVSDHVIDLNKVCGGLLHLLIYVSVSNSITGNSAYHPLPALDLTAQHDHLPLSLTERNSCYHDCPAECFPPCQFEDDCANRALCES